MQELDEFRIHLQSWFATGKNDEAAIATLLQARSQDVLGAHLLISLEIGITERTFQIAAAHTNETLLVCPTIFLLPEGNRISRLLYTFFLHINYQLRF